jgi:tetratricopeptide (TPR) repeat protein
VSRTPREETAASGSAPEAVTVVQSGGTDEPREEVGGWLGRYLIVDALGHGAMGRVVRAYDPKLQRDVALKLLRTGSDAQAKARIVREAQAMAKLAHPNLVAAYDVDLEQGQPFIAMELVEGTTLREWLRASTRPWREIVSAFVDAGRGLAAAHHAGLVHRDFKPDNVLVGTDGRVRVTDFGLSRGIEAHVSGSDLPTFSIPQDSLTVAGTVMGTPGYMAPEQHAGDVVDARSDQYAYCVSLWEALYGRRPFAADDLQSLAKAKLDMALVEPDPSRRVPSFLRRALLRGLAPKPEDRHASMEALMAVLAFDPAVRRRWIALGSVAMLCAAGWWGFGVWQRAAARDECELEAASIDAAWNEQVRATVETSFAATGASYAADAFVRTTPWLDRYVDDWRRMRGELCLVERGLVPGIANPHSAECLEERRAQLEHFVGELTNADARAVSLSVSSAARLPRLAQCIDEVRLVREHPDSDSAALPEVAELRRRLAEVAALGATGRNDAALAAATAVLDDAIAQGDVATIAHARYKVGLAAEKLGRYDEAKTQLEAAFSAAGAAGLDFVALSAVDSLVYVVGDAQAKHEIGLAWGRVGEMLIERLGAQDDPDAASFANTMGGLHHNHGELDRALAYYERALEISERALGPEDPEVPKALTNIATAYLDMGKYDESQAYFERALAGYEAVLGPTHPELGTTLNNAGNLYARQDRIADALAAYERAAVLVDPGNPVLGALLYNTGNAHRRAGNDDRAISYYRRGLDLWRRGLGERHPNVGIALQAIATMELERGELEAAREDIESALAISEAALGREHAQIAGLLLDAGSVYTALGDDARAEALSREALAIWTRTVGEEHPDLALALANIGMIELGRGDLDAALATTERARAIVAASLGETHSNMALPLQNLGRIHFARGDLDTALGLHERALEIAKRTVGESDALALEAQLGIGLVQTAKGEVELAIATLERARTLPAARRLAPRRIAELDDALSRARSLRGGG